MMTFMSCVKQDNEALEGCSSGEKLDKDKNKCVTDSSATSDDDDVKPESEYKPKVKTVSPLEGSAYGGETVTITGNEFARDVVVLIGEAPCTILTKSKKRITCTTISREIGFGEIQVVNPNGKQGIYKNDFEYYGPPTIATVSPNGGLPAGGTEVTITGSNFRPGVTVSMNNTEINSDDLTVQSSNQISFETLVGVEGTVADIVVTNIDTQSTVASDAFTYQPAPSVLSVSPDTADVIGGDTISITGNYFIDGAVVTVGVTTCTSTTYVSSSVLTCVLAQGVAGAGLEIKVTNPDTQVSTNGIGLFEYKAYPIIDNIVNDYGVMDGGDEITISGANINALSTVKIGDDDCTPVTADGDDIKCVTPDKTIPGDYDVLVTTAGLTRTVLNGFTYNPRPTFTGISPEVGPMGGSTSVTIVGTNFNADTTVLIDSKPCTSPNINPQGTQIICLTPSTTFGAKSLRITNIDTQYVEGSSVYTFLETPSAISVLPAEGVSSTTTLLTISGSGFYLGATVTVDDVDCTTPTFVGSDIQCTAPAHATGGDVDVVVTNVDGQSGTDTDGFLYRTPPVVSTLYTGNVDPAKPTHLSVGATTEISITGTMLDDIDTVTIGIGAGPGVDCADADALKSKTLITCDAPTQAAETYWITLLNIDGQSTTVASAIIYHDRPEISSVTNNKGGVGDMITITGSEFYDNAAVTVAGTPCTSVSVINATTITCLTPDHALDDTAVDVVVTNADGLTSLNDGQDDFTYVAAPVVGSVDAGDGPLVGGNEITITGTSFFEDFNGLTPPPTITVAGIACAINAFDNDTTVRCTLDNSTLVAPNTLTGPVVVTNPDGQVSNTTVNYSYRPAPDITSLAITAGNSTVGGGATVRLTGNYFIDGSTISIDGTDCTTSTYVSATEYDCVGTPDVSGNPPPAAQSYDVVISNPDGGQVDTLTNGFTYNAVPTIDSVVPTGGPIAGNTSITISGDDFQLGSTVTINGEICTNPVVSVNPGVDDDGIVCDTPANAAGLYDVVVTMADTQEVTQDDSFTYKGAPTITSLSQDYGADDGTTLAITVNGTNFTNWLDGTEIEFDGVAATCTWVDENRLTCNPPTVAATDPPTYIDVEATNPDDQTGILNNAYRFQDAPTFVSMSLAYGSLSGGELVTITGDNYFTGVTVTIGGSVCTNPTVIDINNLTCNAPLAGSAGAVDVLITNLDDQTSGVGGASAYTYREAPSITSATTGYTPSFSGAAGGGETITISGNNFHATSTVTVGGYTCGNINVTGIITITCDVPTGTGTNLAITVTNGIDNQSKVASDTFSYIEAPTITSLSRTAGTLAGTEEVTINGTNFDVGTTATAVEFGGSPCASLTSTSTTITCDIPAGNGPVAVEVTNTESDNQVATAPAAYTYQEAPGITSVSPDKGAIEGGDTITIDGDNFVDGATVLVGIFSCDNVTFVDDERITCETPSGIAGDTNISVMNADDQDSGTDGDDIFEYRAAPTVVRVLATSGIDETAITTGKFLDESTKITITGTYFDTDGVTVTIGGQVCTGPDPTSSTITCDIPSQVSAGAKDVVVTNTADSQTGTLSDGLTYADQAALVWQGGGATEDYGSSSTNITETFTLENVGNLSTSGDIAITLGGDAPAIWTIGTDNCTGATLTAGDTCTVQVTMLAAFYTPNAYSAEVIATATSGGTDSKDIIGVIVSP